MAGEYDLATLEASGVADVALSPDQILLYAAMHNGNINVYNLLSGQKIATWDIGVQLGGISVSEDGSYLLVTERQPAANVATFYKVATADGAAVTVTTPGSAFRDVEIVDADTAVLTGSSAGNESFVPQQTLYNLQTGTFSGLAGSVYYSGWGTVLSEDNHLTLLAEPGISNGPLKIFDDRTNTIIAQGDSYQTLPSPNRTGFNFGVQAISETAGVVLQWIYHSTVLVYNLNLQYQRYFEVGGPLDGMVIDPTGVYAYVYEQQSGYLAKYAIASGTRVEDYFVGTSPSHNDIGYGSQLLINADGTRITIVDSAASGGKLRVLDLTPDGYFAGTAGADSFAGGTGDDTYLVNHSGDTVTELADQGNDTVETTLAVYNLGANVENLTGLNGTGQALRGNELANVITGGGGNDSLLGGAGNDELLGGDGHDNFRGDDGDDQLSGGSGNDNLRGGRGVDSFDGGTGGELVHFNNTIYGDKVSFYEQFATQGAVADLRTGIISNDGFGNAETMVNIESLGGGTAFVDTFYGNDSLNALFGSIGDFVYGFGGNDYIDLTGAAAVADGGDGTDMLLLAIDEALLLPNADGFSDVMAAMAAGWKVDLTAGTLRDGYGNNGTVAGVENILGSLLGDDLRGDASDNLILGDDGADILRLHDGGVDFVDGGTGNDNIFFIGSLTGADIVTGGEGTDTLILQGPYGALALTSNVSEIENISILGGSNINFGEPGTNRYDYVLTIHDANFAAGVQARINGAALLADEDFTFDGSAETDALFVVYGGKGKDTMLGGQGNDIFFFGEDRFASGDTVNGGPGYDGMFLRGNYGINFGFQGYTGLFTSIENLTLTSATDERYARGGGTEFDYFITLIDANVGAGETLTVSGALLTANESMMLDGGLEIDGSLRLFGGAAVDRLLGGNMADLIHGNLGGDELSGGGGADVFRYHSVAESMPVAGKTDVITDFASGVDKIDLSRIDANSLAAGNQAFTWIGSDAFTGAAGQLRVHFTGTGWLVEGDVDGDAVTDLYIGMQLQQPSNTAPPPVVGDFIL